MSFSYHASDECSPGKGRVINRTPPVIIAGNEEGSSGTVLLQEIQDLSCVDVRTIVKGQSNGAGSEAIRDAGAAVRLRTDQRTGNSRGRRSGRDRIAVTSSAVAELTTWGGTVVRTRAAETRRRAAETGGTGRAAVIGTASCGTLPFIKRGTFDRG